MVTENDIPPSSEERLEFLSKRDIDWDAVNKLPPEERYREFPWYFSPPYDARFPQSRRERQCTVYFLDYQRCRELLGADYKPCKWFKMLYEEVCHSHVLEKYNERLKEGRWEFRFDRYP